MINLRYWRKKRNLTQVQLAALVGISDIYIYEIESCKKVPSIKMIYKLAKVLEICPKNLLLCECNKCKNESTY